MNLFNTAHPLDVRQARDAENCTSPAAALSLASMQAAYANLIVQNGVMENRPRTIVVNSAIL